VAKTLKRAVQKELIRKEAGRLFSERGYRSTNIKDIAKACGFESSNIYYYYHSKEDVLFDVLKDATNRVISQVRHLGDNEAIKPSERLEAFMESHVSVLMGYDRRSYSVLVDAALGDLTPKHRKAIIKRRDTYEMVLRKIIRAGIESGEFNKLNEKLVSFAIISMILRIRLWYSPSGSFSPEKISQFFFKFVMYGLSGGKACLDA